MILSAEDRVALILGRAIMRAEALLVELEAAQRRIDAHEKAEASMTTNPTREAPA